MVFSIENIHTIFKKELTAVLIEEDLESCDLNKDNLVDVIKLMNDESFDFFGVQDKGKIIGYLSREKNDGNNIENSMIKIYVGEIVSKTTPLFDVLRIMKEKEKLFVLYGNKIESIITRADLDKIPVRLLIFSLVNLLEAILLELIRNSYDNENWKTVLSKGRMKNIINIFNSRRNKHEELDLLSCTQFCDKKELIIEKIELIDIIGIDSKKEAEDFLEDAEELRNNIVHAQEYISTKTWREIIEITLKTEEFILNISKYLKKV